MCLHPAIILYIKQIINSIFAQIGVLIEGFIMSMHDLPTYGYLMHPRTKIAPYSCITDIGLERF